MNDALQKINRMKKYVEFIRLFLWLHLITEFYFYAGH